MTQKRLLRQLSGENWDLLFFGFSPQLSAQPTKPLIRWDGEIRGTHCYAVNGPFLDTMIEYMDACERRPRDHPDGGPMPADGVYYHVRRVYTDTLFWRLFRSWRYKEVRGRTSRHTRLWIESRRSDLL